MAIFQWPQGWNDFHNLEREVDRLLQSIRLPFRIQRQFPAINLYELQDEYLLVAALPGTAAEELDLTVGGGLLTLTGERTGPANVAPERFRRQERSRGKWRRSFSLPDRVLTENVSAEFADGLLKVHLPKAGELQPRQIPVSGAKNEGRITSSDE